MLGGGRTARGGGELVEHQEYERVQQDGVAEQEHARVRVLEEELAAAVDDALRWIQSLVLLLLLLAARVLALNSVP